MVTHETIFIRNGNHFFHKNISLYKPVLKKIFCRLIIISAVITHSLIILTYSVLCISERGKDSSPQAEASWTRRPEGNRHKSLQAKSTQAILHRRWLSDWRGDIGQCYRWGYFHLYKILPRFRFWCWVFRDVLIISPHTSKIRPLRTSSCIRAIHLGPKILFNQSRWLSLRFAFKSNVFPVLFVVSISGYVLACFFTTHWMQCLVEVTGVHYYSW